MKDIEMTVRDFARFCRTLREVTHRSFHDLEVEDDEQVWALLEERQRLMEDHIAPLMGRIGVFLERTDVGEREKETVRGLMEESIQGVLQADDPSIALARERLERIGGLLQALRESSRARSGYLEPSRSRSVRIRQEV